MTAADRRPATLAGAAAATYGTNVAAAVLSLGNVLLVARALGASGRGQVALLMTIPLVTSALASLGVQEANANLGAAHPRLRPALATNSVLLALGLGAVAGLAVMGLVSAFPGVGGDVDPHLLWVALGAIPLLVLKLYLNLLAQSDYRFGITNLAWLVGPVTTVTLNGTMAITGVLTVDGAIVVWILGQVLAIGLLVGSVARHFGFGRPDLALARRTLSFGAKSHIGRSLGIGSYRIDQWFVGGLAGSRELGYYSVAVAWAELLFYLPGVIVLLQRPDLVRATRAEAAHIAAQMLRRALYLSVLAGAALAVAAPVLCIVVFGDEFRSSVNDLRVLAASAVGIVVLELLTCALVAQRRPLLASGAMATGFAVTLAGDLLLIPSLGGLGAALATSAAYSVGGVVVLIVFCRALGARPSDLVPRRADLAWYLRKVRVLLSSFATALAAPASASSIQKKRS